MALGFVILTQGRHCPPVSPALADSSYPLWHLGHVLGRVVQMSQSIVSLVSDTPYMGGEVTESLCLVQDG